MKGTNGSTAPENGAAANLPSSMPARPGGRIRPGLLRRVAQRPRPVQTRAGSPMAKPRNPSGWACPAAGSNPTVATDARAKPCARSDRSDSPMPGWARRGRALPGASRGAEPASSRSAKHRQAFVAGVDAKDSEVFCVGGSAFHGRDAVVTTHASKDKAARRAGHVD